MKRFIPVIGLLGLVLVLAIGAQVIAQNGKPPAAEKNPYETKVKEGDLMPDILAVADPINKIKPELLKDKIVLYNVFAYWCPPCNAEAPDLQELYTELKAQGVEVVGIASGRMQDVKTEDFIQKNLGFVEKHKWTIPLIHDPDRKITQLLGIKAFPTSFLVDRNGKIVEVVVGGGAGIKDEWIKRINPLLAPNVTESANHPCCGEPQNCPDKDCAGNDCKHN